MNKTVFAFLLMLMAPTFANAGETKVLYYHHKLKSFPQVTKGYYIKESLKRFDSKNPNLLQDTCKCYEPRRHNYLPFYSSNKLLNTNA